MLLDPDFIHLPKKGVHTAFEAIRGYRVQTALDHKLILGIWRQKEGKFELAADAANRLPIAAAQTRGQQFMLMASNDFSISVDQ